MKRRGSVIRKTVRAALAAIAFVSVWALLLRGYQTWFEPVRGAVSGDAIASASVRLSGPFDPQFAGEMVALRAGLYRANKLRVDLESGASQLEPIRDVAEGRDTIGVASPALVLSARAQGVPLVAFAAGYVESPVVFYALKDANVHAPADFVGKRVGYQSDRGTAIIYEAMLNKANLSRASAQEVKVSSDFSPLISGRVDVWPGHVGVESYALISRGIGFDVINPDEYGVHVPGSVYFAREDTVRDHPDVIERFLQATLGGWRLTYADYDKSVSLVSGFNPDRLPSDFVRFKLEEQRSHLRPLGSRFCEFDNDHWRALQAILVQQRRLQEPLDISKAVTYVFLQDAYRKSALTLEKKLESTDPQP